MEKLGELKTQIRAKRKKVEMRQSLASVRGRKSKESIQAAAVLIKEFEKKHQSKIQPHMDNLSRKSGISEMELRDLFSAVLKNYASTLKQARKQEGRDISDQELLVEVHHDLFALLFDFQATIKQVTKRKQKTSKMDKKMVLKIMQKYNPHILSKLWADPELRAVYSEYDINTAVLRREDGEKFLRGKIADIKRLWADPELRAVYSEYDINTAVLRREDGEKFLRGKIADIKRLWADPELRAVYSESDINTAVLRREDGEKFLRGKIADIKRLWADPELRAVYSEYDINTAVLNREKGEEFLRKFIPVIREGMQIIENLGIVGAAPKIKLRRLFIELTKHQNAEKLTTAFLQKIKREMRQVLYPRFELAFLAATQNMDFGKENLYEHLARELGIGSQALNVYLAQFFESIFIQRKLKEYQKSLGPAKNSKLQDADFISRIGRVDRGFDKLTWSLLLDDKFPRIPSNEREEVLEQLQILGVPEDKIVQVVNILGKFTDFENKEKSWRMFRHLILMDFGKLPLHLLIKLQEELK